MKSSYQKDSITLLGGVSMGTDVMIGAGIFALTCQIAELAGPWFPLSFVAGAIVTTFSACTYVKMSNAYSSAGGVAMILQKAYGPGAVATAASAREDCCVVGLRPRRGRTASSGRPVGFETTLWSIRWSPRPF